MHCHCGTNNRAPRWTFTDPCKPEVRPGAREESASPSWLATPAMNDREATKGIYGGLILDVVRHYIGSVKAITHREKGIITLESNPSRGTVLPAPHGKGNKCDKNVEYKKKLMHCHCGTNNRAPRWKFTDPCKPEVRSGAREKSAWLAAPGMNDRDATKDIYGGLTLDVDRHYIGSGTTTTRRNIFERALCSTKKYSADDIIKMLEFLVENIFVVWPES